jgi:hypothetical protein
MKLVHHVAPTAAAVVCLWGASTALPTYPHNVPWPNWVSFAALAAALATYLLWFYLAAWAIARASQIRYLFVRVVLYVVTFFAVSVVPLTPLLSAYGIFGLCRVGLDCGQNLQGAFNVLHVAAFELNIWVSIIICIAFVGTVIPLSRRPDVRQSAAQPSVAADAPQAARR